MLPLLGYYEAFIMPGGLPEGNESPFPDPVELVQLNRSAIHLSPIAAMIRDPGMTMALR